MATRRSRSSRGGSGRDPSNGRFAPRRSYGSVEDMMTIGVGAAIGLVIDRVNDEAEDFANYAREWMQTNRPWEDRTDEARSGLNAEVTEKAPPNVVITMFHTAEHGIFLELGTSRHDQYSIIGPALEELGPEFMNRLGGVW